eukprot:jgi/Mesvir1/18300/Mv18455-RA.1
MSTANLRKLHRELQQRRSQQKANNATSCWPSPAIPFCSAGPKVPRAPPVPLCSAGPKVPRAHCKDNELRFGNLDLVDEDETGRCTKCNTDVNAKKLASKRKQTRACQRCDDCREKDVAMKAIAELRKDLDLLHPSEQEDIARIREKIAELTQTIPDSHVADHTRSQVAVDPWKQTYAAIADAVTRRMDAVGENAPEFDSDEPETSQPRTQSVNDGSSSPVRVPLYGESVKDRTLRMLRQEAREEMVAVQGAPPKVVTKADMDEDGEVHPDLLAHREDREDRANREASALGIYKGRQDEPLIVQACLLIF